MKRVLWMVVSVCLLSGCAAEVEKNAAEIEAAVPDTASTAAPSATASTRPSGPRLRGVVRRAKKAGPGRLRLAYRNLNKPERKEIADVFREVRLFEDVVDELNRGLVLPHDIDVRVQECNEVNAFYDPNKKQMTLCYELFDHLMGSFADDQTDEEEAGSKAVAALVFMFYHELGHALIDVYDLPVTGREEDAVDQLATVLLLETWEGEDSELAILSSAEWFGIEEEDEELDMADEHSLDDQRYYNLVCWIYGSDPEYFSELADDWGLPEARAERCSSEYERMSSAWNTLLGPHMHEATSGGSR